MKTQISRISHDPNKGYSGVYLQQGRMILDADWNELNDIQRKQLVDALADAILSGAPREGGLELLLSAGQVRIHPGRLYVDGIQAEMAASLGDILPTAQPDYPNPPALAGNQRFYADVWERAVSALEDANLMDPGLHGADTATRTQIMLQVKWCATGTDPLTAPDNPALGSAPLALKLRQVISGGDACDPCAAEVEVDERIGNYLFRVEVHDVYRSAGDLFLILKWSRDNGAEAYAVGQEPVDFRSGDWVWEFFDTATEKQLGNHLPLSVRRRRGMLRDSYLVPDGASEPKTLVRQWDGYAEVNVTTAALVAGRDRGVPLSTGLDVNAHAKVTFNAGHLQINLELMELDLALTGQLFVAGDYWLAPVREAVDESGDFVLGDSTAGVPPQGIIHHYLRLGDFVGGVLTHPSDMTADAFRRRMNFPPLTDLHADEVAYTPPAGCDGLFDGAVNVKEALDQLCDIDAADIGYDLNCAPGNTVASLLAAKLGALWPNLDGVPKNPSVQDMLQALLCHLSAAELPYAVPSCASSPNVAEGLGLAAGDDQNVAEVLNRLLCQLNADDIPLDTATLQCQDLKESGETSVQGALDFLCATRLAQCAVSIPAEPPGLLEQTLRDFAKNEQAANLWLCLMPGEHKIVGDALEIKGKTSLRLSAAAAGASTIFFSTQPASFQAQELGLEGVRCRFSSSARLTLQAFRITASRCSFTRTGTNETPPPMIRLNGDGDGSELYWRDNVMSDTWSHAANNSRDLFTVERVGNNRVAALLTEMQENPALLEDPEQMRVKAGETAEAIADMSGRERLAWRNRVRSDTAATDAVQPGRVSSRSRATLATEVSMSRAPLINAIPGESTLSFLANANTGSVNRDQARVAVESAIDRINAADDDVAIITDILIGDIFAVLYEFGYGVALAMGDTNLSGALTDNHVDGEVLLMNGTDSGMDPRTLDIQKNSVTGLTVSPARGRLTLSGNRIQRLWAHLPTDKVKAGTLSESVPGYEAMTLTGNIFNGFGHLLIAQMLTGQGNQFHFPRSSEADSGIGTLITDNTAFSGNAATLADDAFILTLVARASALAANLVFIRTV